MADRLKSVVVLAVALLLVSACKKDQISDTSTPVTDESKPPTTQAPPAAATDPNAAEAAAQKAYEDAIAGYKDALDKLDPTNEGVDYQAIDEGTFGKLDAFLTYAAGTEFPMKNDSGERGAFLANVYNAKMVSLILNQMKSGGGRAPTTIWKDGPGNLKAKMRIFAPEPEVRVKSFPLLTTLDQLLAAAGSTIKTYLDTNGGQGFLYLFACTWAAKDGFPLLPAPLRGETLRDDLARSLKAFVDQIGQIQDPKKSKELAVPFVLSTFRDQLSVNVARDPRLAKRRFAVFLWSQLKDSDATLAQKIVGFEDAKIVPKQNANAYNLDIKEQAASVGTSAGDTTTTDSATTDQDSAVNAPNPAANPAGADSAKPAAKEHSAPAASDSTHAAGGTSENSGDNTSNRDDNDGDDTDAG